MFRFTNLARPSVSFLPAAFLSLAFAMVVSSPVFSQTGTVVAVPEAIGPGQVLAAPLPTPIVPPMTLGVRIKQGAEGVSIVAVNPGSAAERAGIRVGDEIRYVADRQVRTTQELTNEVLKATPGQKVDMFIARDKEPFVTTVTFPGTPPAEPTASPAQVRALQQQVYQLNQQLHYQNQAIQQMRSSRMIRIPPTDPADYEWWLRVQRGETNNDPAIFQ